MKNLLMVGVVLLVIIVCNNAFAKPFKVENSNGQLVRCGDWKNTPNAMVIRGCPQLGDFLDNDANPEPTPDSTPEPTPIPTPTPRPVTCEYRYVETDEGYKLDIVYPVGVVTHTCMYMPFLNKRWVELTSVNRANTQCNSFDLLITSPSGIIYDVDPSTQPGHILYPEVGTWQIDVKLETEGLCAINKALLINILTKG